MTTSLLEPRPRPRFDLLRERSTKDWGEAPGYNAEYKKIRWPGSTPMPPERPEDVLPGEIPRTTIFYPLPSWLSLIRADLEKKRSGEWTKNYARIRLRSDISTCIRENIPFKTKTFEYKPETQWVYVNGIPALRYDIRTGHIIDFSYSGVYNKRTSLLFRMFDIYITLKKGKLILKHRSVRPARVIIGDLARTHFNETVMMEIPINITQIYNFIDIDRHISRGFYQIDHSLAMEHLYR